MATTQRTADEHAQLPNSPAEATGIKRGQLAGVIATLAAAWLLVLLFRNAVPTAAGLFELAGGAHPYWQPAHAFLLYILVPLVVLSAFTFVLTPALLLVLAHGSARTAGEWLLQALAVTLILLPGAHAIVIALRGPPVTAGSFIALVGVLSFAAAILLALRLRRRAAPVWPLHARGERAVLLSMALLSWAIMAALAPKFLWENFNGDGAHAFEASRLLLNRAFPFWDAAAGDMASWPGITTMLFTYPASWFIQLFGPIEVSVRVPFLLYLAAVFGAICTLAAARARVLDAWELGLLACALVIYTMVVSYSATYSAYSADIALPGTQDTLLVVCFLGFIMASVAQKTAWTVLFGVLTHLTLPNGLLLMGFWWLAIALLWRPMPWRQLTIIAGIAVGCLVLGSLAPVLLAAAGQAAPGGELGGDALLKRFNWLQVTDWRRFLYVAVPCGIVPAISLFAWRRQDSVSRAVTLVVVAYFLFTYVQAYASLHYYIPSMLLPLVVFWRNEWVSERARPRLLFMTGLAAVLSLWLSFPENPAPYTAARALGATIEDRVGGYERSGAQQLRSAVLLAHLFPYDWDPAVPKRAHGGSPLVWNYYAHAAQRAPANYVLQRASDPPLSGARRIAAEDGYALYVRDTTLWSRQRGTLPPNEAGAPLYQVPRPLLFRAGSNGEFRIINVRAWLKRLGLRR